MNELRGPSEDDINFSAGDAGEDDDLSPEEKQALEEDEIFEQRRLKNKATLNEPTPVSESISEEEKRARATEIVVDLIGTSKEPKLKAQSDEARAKFIEQAIAEFDQRGWTLPKNIHQLQKDGATDQDKERAKILKAIARECKVGTDLM